MFPESTKIMVVDDMAMFRAMVKNTLTELHYKNYVEFADGEAAWKGLAEARALKQPFQLIISDWTMPKMKGIELLKKVRAEPWGTILPFVMLTGETEKDLIVDAIQSKVTQYIVKPFTKVTLKEKLDAAHKKWTADKERENVI